MDKILILGDSGLVGKEIIHQFKKDYNIYGLSRNSLVADNWNHKIFDLEKSDITDVLEEVKPDIIISCTRGDFKSQLNIHRQIAGYCIKHNVRLYYFSTASVFDLNPDSVKYEYDEPCAESDYGKFKIECENLLKDELGKNVIIIRPPMIFGKNSLRLNRVITALKTEEPMDLHSNLYITTVLDIDLVTQLKYIIKNDLRGIFHIASNDVINHIEFHKILTDNKVLYVENRRGHYDKYYVAIKTHRTELETFRFTNFDVINKLKEYLSCSLL